MKERINNDSFADQSVYREAGETDTELSICLYKTNNERAWIEITFAHKDGEMRYWRA